MSWSIAEVARHSGLSARTLRHYDAIGLLAPAWTARDGRRYYEREQLLRLQRILLLREIGLGLRAIAAVLAAQDAQATLEVLRQHQSWLLKERERVDRLITTVAHTMTMLESGGDMPIDEMFAGFEPNPYEAEARERWGSAAVDESKQRLRNLAPQDAEFARDGFSDVVARLARLRSSHCPMDSTDVQSVVADHYRWLSLFWTPDADSYRGLADMYVEDERFRQNIGPGDDGLVEYLRDAMHIYATQHLS
jgi:DNA-binding transcriptional MerR regulator